MPYKVRIFGIAIKIAFVLSLLSVLMAQPMQAQEIDRADSVYKALLSSPTDTLLIREFNNRVNIISFELPDTALFYAREGLNFAEEAGFTYGITIFTNMIGLCYEMMEDYNNARVYYRAAMAISEEHSYTRSLTNIYNNLSILESTLGNYAISLDYLLKAFRLAEKMQDTGRLAVITNNIGLRYSELQNQDKALEFYKMAMILHTSSGKENRIVNVLGNIGRSYYMLDEYDSARIYYSRSRQLAIENENKLALSTAFMGLGMVFFAKDEIDSALKYQQMGSEIAANIGDEWGLAQSLLFIGNIQIKQKKYAEAEGNILACIHDANRLGIRPLLIDAYLSAAELYENIGDFKEALKYKTLHTNLQDNLYNIEKGKALNMISDYEQEKSSIEKEILTKEVELEKLNGSRQRMQRNLFIITGVLLFLLAGGLLHRFIYIRRTRNRLADQNVVIREEKDRSDDLLHNILPHETALELKLKGSAKSRYYEQVSVMFTDFVGFTSLAEKMEPDELVSLIHHYFSQFDNIITRHGVEKIKTIGDAYMCAGGLPVPNNTHALDVVKASIEIRDFINTQSALRKEQGLPAFNIRIGIHTGPVVAGIVGTKKFAYDIWGDTVNTASRIESSGEPGMINISQTTKEIIQEDFTCTCRGKIEAKGKGEINMYFVK